LSIKLRSEETKVDTKIFLNIARYHSVVEEYDRAIENYEFYLKNNPSDEHATLEYTRSLFWNGKTQKGLNKLKRLINRKGRRVDFLLEYATMLSFSSRFKKAIDIYGEVLRTEPSNLSAHLGLSYIYLTSTSESRMGKNYRKRIKQLQDKFKFEIQKDLKKAKRISDRLKYKPSKDLTEDQILLELAYLKRNISEWNESISYFKKYLKRNDDSNVRFELAKTYNWAKRLPKAIKELKIILKKNKNDRKALKELALYESWTGRYKSSETHYLTLLENDPSNNELKLGLADNYKWSNKHKKASKLYKEVLDSEPDNARAKEGFMKTAQLDSLLNKLKKEPKNKELILSVHEAYISSKKYNEDIVLLSDYLKEFPKDIEILTELAKTYSNNADWNKAIATNKKILKIERSNEYALGNLPIVYMWSEDFPKADKSFAALESQKGLTIEQKFYYGDTLKNLKQRKRALGYYRSIIKTYPDQKTLLARLIELDDTKTLTTLFYKSPRDRELSNILSSSHISKNELIKAEKILKRHLKSDPYDLDSKISLARVLSWQGKYPEALDVYHELLKTKRLRKRKDLKIEEAKIFAWNRQYDISERRLNAILQDDPDNSEVLTELARIYNWKGDKEKEIKTYDRIIKANPVNIQARRMKEEAINHPSYKIHKLEKQLKTDPNNTSLIKNIANLYEQTGDYEKSLFYTNKLLEKNPKDKALQTKAEQLKIKSTKTSKYAIKTHKSEISQKPFSREPRKRYISYLISKDKLDEAIDQMQQYLLIYPEDNEMRHQLALAYSWQSRYTESSNEFETLLLQNPANIHYKLSLARILSWEGEKNYSESLKLSSDVIKLDPNKSEAYLIRGNIYNWTSNYNKALRDYKEVLKKESSSYDERKEAKEGIDSILQYDSNYLVTAGIEYKADNNNYKQFSSLLGFDANWNRTLDSSLQYYHHIFFQTGNPDVNADHIRLYQGVRLGDPIYLNGFIGFTKYHSIQNTIDYGASLKYTFGWRDSVTLGYENTDIITDSLVYGSVSPSVIDSDYILARFLFHTSAKTSLDIDTRFGFYSDNNKTIGSNILFAWNVSSKPFISLMANLRFYRVQDKLWTPIRYWDPSYYIAFVPGMYLETPISKKINFFMDLQLGYGNEEGNSVLEFHIEPGFEFKITKHLSAKTSAFYGHTGKSINTRNYYLWGAKAYIYIDF